MSEQLRESVSALVDGEADELELRRILAYQDRATVDRAWCEFHRTRSALHGESMTFSQMDISARVSAALQDEQAMAAGTQSRWLKPLAGLAVAASVSFVVVMGGMQFGPGTAPSGGGLAAIDQQGGSRAYPAQASLTAPGSVAVSAELAAKQLAPGEDVEAARLARQRLDEYILRHTETVAVQGSRGLMPFARVASYEIE